MCQWACAPYQSSSLEVLHRGKRPKVQFNAKRAVLRVSNSSVWVRCVYFDFGITTSGSPLLIFFWLEVAAPGFFIGHVMVLQMNIGAALIQLEVNQLEASFIFHFRQCRWDVYYTKIFRGSWISRIFFQNLAQVTHMKTVKVCCFKVFTTFYSFFVA